MENQAQYLVAVLAKLLPDDLPEQLRPEYRRRLEIMLRTHLGQSQAEICAALGCSQEMARYWMTMAEIGRTEHWYTQSLGRPKRITDEYLNRLKELVCHSPQNYGYSFERWTARYLGKHLAQEFDIEISARHINRLLQQMGLSTRGRRSIQRNSSVRQSNRNKNHITISDLHPTS
jgi:transposase